MGQKVHPLGFRLVTTQKSHSNWFSTFKQYPKCIEEDYKIRQYIYQKNKAGIAKIEIKRNTNGDKIEINIHTARPGVLVGKSGVTLQDIYSNLQKIIKDKPFTNKLDKTIIIQITETKEPNTNANLIGDYIVEQLEKRIAFRRVIRKAVQKLQKAKIKGIKIQISGRLNGAEIARSEWIREGRVPLHTLRADIDYAEKRAETSYGIIGIKVWLFKREIFKTL